MFDTNFTVLDWGIVVAYLAGTVALGLYVNRHIHSAADYLVGGRASGTALSVATLVGTELGLVTLMYSAQDAFVRGFAYLAVPILGLSTMAMLGATGLGISRLRQLGLTTIPEYFERRFNRRVRIVAGILCATAGILNMGLFPKMGATFITYATGLGHEGGVVELAFFGQTWVTDSNTLVINAITSGLILLVLAYTVTGGMVAVIVTDYLQFVVLSVGMALGLVFCFTTPGLGWENITQTWAAERGEAAFNPTHADSYGWTYFGWQVCLMVAAGLCWAPSASRALTTKDSATTRRTFLFASPGMFARNAIPGIWGIAAFCFILSDAELAEFLGPAALAENPGRAAAAMPLLVGKIVPTGLVGLLVAGLMAAFMSTHDSYLLGWSSVISQDIVAPLRRTRSLTDAQSIRVTRVSVVLIGIFLLAWGIWYELPASVWSYMSVTGSIYLSGAATALLGGMYWRRASSSGALLAMLGGLFAVSGLFLKPLQNALAEWLDLPADVIEYWLNDGSVGLATYVLCGMLFVAGSLAWPDPPNVGEVEPTREHD